jgi:hypothetical protein
MTMAKKTQLNVENIIASNPRISREAFQKGIETLRKLERSGAVKPSTYSLETPDSRRTVRYCYEEVEIRRGATIRLKRR